MPTTTGKATDFITFSRASLATVTDSDGKIKWAPHNLLLASEQFDSSQWTKSALTVTANNVAAPNGSTTADLSVPNTTNTQHSVSQTVTFEIGDSIVGGVFVKPAGYSKIALFDLAAGNRWVSFNLSGSGSILASGPSATGAITALSDGWYFISIAEATGASAMVFTVYVLDNAYTNASPLSYSYAGNGTSGVYLWGAHLYRNNLGGMVANTSAYPMYNPTTPKNLLAFSENFSASPWLFLTAGVTISSNTETAPNGLQTADALAFTSTAYMYQNATLGTITNRTFTFSVWLWSTTGKGTIVLRLTSSTVGSDDTRLVVSLTSTPTRYSVTRTFTSAATQVDFGFDNRTIIGGDGVAGSIVAWGAQLSDSASLDPYVANAFAAPTAAAYHGPRLDYSGSSLSALGLLVEEQRTNLQLYSEALDNVFWTKFGVTVAANNATAPSGTMTADTVTEDTSNGVHYISSGITLAANTSVAYSFYAKRSSGTRNLRVTLFTASSGLRALVNFDTLSVTNQSYGSSTYTSGTVTVVGNGWYRVAIVGIPSPTEANPAVDFVFHNGTGVSYTGDGTSGFQMWGFQAEAGAFATSYIPTGASTVTRSADVASVATSAFPYSASASSLIANVSVLSVNTAGFKSLAALSDNTANNRILLYQAASATSAWQIVSSGGATQSNITPGSVSANTPFKLGTAVAPNDAAAYLNGSAGTPDNSVNMPAAATIMYIGGSAIGVEQLNGHIRQITYIPRRLSNAELQARTA